MTRKCLYHYAVTISQKAKIENFHDEFSVTLLHKRHDFTEAGLLRILKREGKVAGDAGIIRVERMLYEVK